MANPASVYCEQNGGKLEIRDETDGQVGYCMFTDGSECEEWAYMRGECKQGEAKESTAIGMPNPASVFCTDNGGTLEMRKDASGGEYGMCLFSDGSECEEWAYFRGECTPGQATPPPPTCPTLPPSTVKTRAARSRFAKMRAVVSTVCASSPTTPNVKNGHSSAARVPPDRTRFPSNLVACQGCSKQPWHAELVAYLSFPFRQSTSATPQIFQHSAGYSVLA